MGAACVLIAVPDQVSVLVCVAIFGVTMGGFIAFVPAVAAYVAGACPGRQPDRLALRRAGHRSGRSGR